MFDNIGHGADVRACDDRPADTSASFAHGGGIGAPNSRFSTEAL